MLNNLKEKGAVLYLDNGGVVPDKLDADTRFTARLGYQIMQDNGMAAVGLSPRDCILGLDYLSGIASDYGVKFVSTNLALKEKGKWLKKSIIVNVGGRKIGIISLLPENAFAADKFSEIRTKVSISSPKQVLAEVVPTLAQKVDGIILLSRLDKAATTDLINNYPAVLLAVVPGSDNHPQIIKKPSSREIVVTGRHGLDFLVAHVKNIDGSPKIFRLSRKELDDNVAHNDKVDELIVGSYSRRNDSVFKAKKALNEQVASGAKVPKTLSKEEFEKFIKEKQEELARFAKKGEKSAVDTTSAANDVRIKAEDIPGYKPPKGEVVGSVMVNGIKLPLVRTKKAKHTAGGDNSVGKKKETEVVE